MDLRIDSHKLLYHPARIASWMSGENILPINMEICITGACNHRCIFCCYDYLEYKPDSLDYDVFMKNIRDVSPLTKGEHGVKSILFAGTGEPALHPDFVDIINGTKRCGVDVALSTNGVLFTPEKANACMASISWIRFSVSGGTEETYHRIHRGMDGDLQRVFDNIQYAVELKKQKKLRTVLNVQIVMIPDNLKEIFPLAQRVKELGADNFIVKSYGANKSVKNNIQNKIEEKFYAETEELQTNLTNLSDGKFKAIYRSERIKNEFSGKNYAQCYALPFYAFITADGGVYPCNNFSGVFPYCYGNIHTFSLEEILLNKKGSRQLVLEKIKKERLASCITACRLEAMNQYLDELVNPGEHVNFI